MNRTYGARAEHVTVATPQLQAFFTVNNIFTIGVTGFDALVSLGKQLPSIAILRGGLIVGPSAPRHAVASPCCLPLFEVEDCGRNARDN